MRVRPVILVLLGLAGCGETAAETTSSTSTAPGTGGAGGNTGGAGAEAGAGGAIGGAGGGTGGDGAAPACNSAARPLPDGLVELAWDDGVPEASVLDNDWQITVGANTYLLAEGPLHEAVRFEIDRPAKIHGFAVEWAPLPEGTDPTAELVAGLYPDFGHNGFDFWEKDPYFTGARCASDIATGELLPYTFEQPVVLEHPGLVYVAHRMSTPADPVFMYDSSTAGAGECLTWDECHSSMNLPDAEKSQFYNGVSFPFTRDYRVRLYVEYTDDLAPEDKIFQPPPTPGPGPTAHVSFGDYDADGLDDMLTDGPTLWHNLGNGTFEDATAAAGIAALALSATGGVFGDYDDDGCLDLFLYAESYVTTDSLLRSSCDGTFEDVTAAAGITDIAISTPCGADPANTNSPAAAAAWLDIDADGWLDLYIANFNCWDTYTYYVDAVWHNLGDGTFESWTAKNGFTAKKTPSRGAAPADFDRDGDVDLFVNNYVLHQNLLFVNDGDGTVTEKAKLAGVDGDGTTGYTFGHTIGAAWGDLDNDGDLDLVSANLAHPRFYDFSDKTEILLQNPDHTFTDIAGDWAFPASAAGLRYQETHSVPALADFDHDGNLDLAITAIYDGRPTDFYWGKGDGTFTLDAWHAGITTENGWGAGVSDVDNDGDPDLFASTLFLNSGKAQKGHWVQIRALGTGPLAGGANRAAIGATVQITTAATSRIRHVQGGTGKGGQDSMYLHFGLGSATELTSITVTFPGGKQVTFPGPHPVDQRLWIREDGAIEAGWTNPF